MSEPDRETGRRGDKPLGGPADLAVEWDAHEWRHGSREDVVVRVFERWTTTLRRCFATVTLTRSVPQAAVSMVHVVPNSGSDEAIFRLRFDDEHEEVTLYGDVPIDRSSWFRGEFAVWGNGRRHHHHRHHPHHHHHRRHDERAGADPYAASANPLDPTAPDYGAAPVAWGRIIDGADTRLFELLTVPEQPVIAVAETPRFVVCPVAELFPAGSNTFYATLDAERTAGDLAGMKAAAAQQLPAFEQAWTLIAGSPGVPTTYQSYPAAVRTLRAHCAELNLGQFVAELAQLLGIDVDPFAPDPLADSVAAFAAYVQSAAFLANEQLAWEIAFCGGLTSVPVALTNDVAEDVRCTGLVRRIAGGAHGLDDESRRREALNAVLVLPAGVLPPQGFLTTGSVPLGSPPWWSGSGAARSSFAPLGVGELSAIDQRLERYSLGEIASVQNVMARERVESIDRETTRDAELTTSESAETSAREREERDALVTDVRQELHDLLRRDAVTRNYTDLTVSPTNVPVPFLVTVGGSWNGWGGEDRRDAVQALNAAKEVVSRTVERIESRIGGARAALRISERERSQVREVDNRESARPVSAVYRYVQQRHRMRLRRLGRRLVVEFMLVDPAASFLAHVTSGVRGELIEPVSLAKSKIHGPSDITVQNAQTLAAAYGLEGLSLPPQQNVVVGATLDQGRWNTTLTIPPGYTVSSASVAGITSDQTMIVVGTIGTTPFMLTAGSPPDVSPPAFASPVSPPPAADAYLGAVPFGYAIVPPATAVPAAVVASPPQLAAAPGTTAIDVACYSAAPAYRVSVQLTCAPEAATTASPAAWQISAYESLVAAYDRALHAYESALTRRIEASARPGAAALIAERLIQDAIATVDLQDGVTDPALSRHLLEAFDWNAMTYAFYPWPAGEPVAPPRAWVGQIVRGVALDGWLRSFVGAQSARVLVPLRRGYEIPALFALIYGAPWSGGAAAIPALEPYVPWLERVAEPPFPNDEDPVEWHVTVPTALTVLQSGDELPHFDGDERAQRSDDR